MVGELHRQCIRIRPLPEPVDHEQVLLSQSYINTPLILHLYNPEILWKGFFQAPAGDHSGKVLKILSFCSVKREKGGLSPAEELKIARLPLERMNNMEIAFISSPRKASEAAHRYSYLDRLSDLWLWWTVMQKKYCLLFSTKTSPR